MTTTFQTKFKELRKKTGLKQADLSERLEIPLDDIKSWECGRRQPPEWVQKLLLEKLEQIAAEKKTD